MNVMSQPNSRSGLEGVRSHSTELSLYNQLYTYAEDFQQLLQEYESAQKNLASLELASRDLRNERSILNALINASKEIHLTTDEFGVIVQCNDATTQLDPPASLMGQPLRDLVSPLQQDFFDTLLTDAAHRPEVSETEFEFELHSQLDIEKRILAAVRVLPILEAGRVHSLHWIIRDITAKREAQFESRVASMVYKSVVEAIMITDVDGHIMEVNAAFSRITGYEHDEVIGETPRILKSGFQDDDFYESLWRKLRTDGEWCGDIVNRKKNGEIYPQWQSISTARDADGNQIGFICVFHDRSRLDGGDSRAMPRGFYDTLTGLPNRLLLQDRIEQLIHVAARNPINIATISVSANAISTINKSFGANVGDQVLITTANRLLENFSPGDTVARVRGAQFIVVVTDVESSFKILKKRATAALAEPVIIDGRSIPVVFRLRIVNWVRGMSAVDLMNQADNTMARIRCEQ